VGEPFLETGGPVQRAEAAELFDRIRGAIAELPAKQAQAFWLVCMAGFSHDEAACHLSMTPNESRVLVHRARTHLKSVLNAQSLKARQNR